MFSSTVPATDNEGNVMLTALQSASMNWKSFDWPKQRSTIDVNLSQQKDTRESSVAARKQLAETTKFFKRSVKTVEQSAAALQNASTPENVSATCKAIDALGKQSRTTVKAYQEEVDNITRRCKSTETCYSQLCQSLSEMPDPAVVLSSCMDQMQAQQAQMSKLLSTLEEVNKELQAQEKVNQSYKKEIAALQSKSGGAGSGSGMNKEERDELVRLRREVAEYEVEFRSLKNQDITIRKLESKIAEMQVAGEEEMKEQLEKAKEELAETEGRRAIEALEREAAMERKVQTLELQLKAERAGREATQTHLLEADEGVSQREAAWEAQRQILVDDSERLRESLQAASRERDELRLRVAALEGKRDKGSSSHTPPPSGGGASVADLMLERKAYEAEVAELSATAAGLREELRVKDELAAEERRNFRATIDQLEREKATVQTTATNLQVQLSSAPSQALVENMRRELRILKRLEYNADDIEQDHSRDPEIAGVNEEKDLESVLVAKLRRAESELVQERTSNKELQHEYTALKEALTTAEAAKDEADKLVFSLEKDLERAISASPGKPLRKPTTPAHVSEGDPATLQSVLDPEAPSASSETGSSGGLKRMASAASSASAKEKADDDHSVATIVMAQRDRLRARCEALEAERDSFKRELQGQVAASECLKADNTKLYEKVRYLQNYNRAPNSRGGFRTNVGSGDRDLDLEALEQRYEASVDPFRQFSKAERQRKLNEMSPVERTVFLVAKTFLATKEMRTALFFYVLAMHLLVFVTTYHWSHNDACPTAIDHEQLSHLPPKIPDHIKGQVSAKVDQGATGGP